MQVEERKAMVFEERDVIANIPLLTHQRNNQGAMLDPKLLERDCPLDNGRHEAGKQAHDLGILEKLPQELLYLMFIDLDLQSLTHLRAVNRRARSAVDSL